MNAADRAIAALLAEVLFEHLDHAENEMWRFMAECWTERSTGRVPLFFSYNQIRSVAVHGGRAPDAP